MSTTEVPNPGPALSPSTSYRELAKQHAAAADRLLNACPVDYLDSPDVLASIALAQAHALASVAFTNLAPPARFRPPANHARTGGAR